MEASGRGKDSRIATDSLGAQNHTADVCEGTAAADRTAVEVGQPHRPPQPAGPRHQEVSEVLPWPRVSVVIPTLNEALNLPHVLRAIPDCVHEVVVVDGLSTDGTPEVALEHRPDAKLVYETGAGKGVALQRGFDAATGDILVMMDADGSADPYEIPAFLEVLLAGADFAKGTRFCPGGGSSDITPLRAFGNRALGAAVNGLFRTKYTDLCYGYNAFWRHCLSAMKVDCNGFEVETLINIRVARAGLTVSEVPSFERDRLHGQSNLRTFRDGSRVLRTIVRERVRRAPHSHDVNSEIAHLATPVVEDALLSPASD